MGVVMQVRILWMEKLVSWCLDGRLITPLSKSFIQDINSTSQMLGLNLQVRIPSKVETPGGSPVKQPQTEVLNSFYYCNPSHMLLFIYKMVDMWLHFCRICSLPPRFFHQFTSWIFLSEYYAACTCVL